MSDSNGVYRPQLSQTARPVYDGGWPPSNAPASPISGDWGDEWPLPCMGRIANATGFVVEHAGRLVGITCAHSVYHMLQRREKITFHWKVTPDNPAGVPLEVIDVIVHPSYVPPRSPTFDLAVFTFNPESHDVLGMATCFGTDLSQVPYLQAFGYAGPEVSQLNRLIGRKGLFAPRCKNGIYSFGAVWLQGNMGAGSSGGPWLAWLPQPIPPEGSPERDQPVPEGTGWWAVAVQSGTNDQRGQQDAAWIGSDVVELIEEILSK